METRVADLSDLHDASPPAASSSGPGRHRAVYLVPAAVLVACVAVFAYVTADRWMPAVPVRAERAVMLAGETGVAVSTETVSFQAAGWIEADPFPVLATALVSGVVEQVAVLEGERVEAGQVLARLDDADHRLALAQAEAALAAAEAQVAVAAADERALRAELPAVTAHIDTARARRAVMDDRHRRLEAGGAAVSEVDRTAARLEAEALAGEVAVAEADRIRLDADIAHAAARVAAAEAAVAAQRVAVEMAHLDLERTVISAPIGGIIQRLYARPGRKQMLGGESATSTTVASIVDPASLQVRVDVALADAAGLFVGQRARISVEALPDREFAGTVTRIVGEADVTRNTLQAKVAITDPDRLLRPEMLARVQFLGRDQPETTAANASASAQRLYIPPAALVDRDNGRARCWAVVDDGRRVEERMLELAGEREGWVGVVDGLRPGEQVVLDPPADLHTGTRIRIREGATL